MAIINTLRLRNALVRGGIAQDEPACELVDIVDDEFSKLATNFVTRESHEASEHRVLAAIADLGRRAAERDAERAYEAEQRAREAADREAARAQEAAERDRQIHTHITIGIGLIIGAITIATAVISIVIVVLD